MWLMPRVLFTALAKGGSSSSVVAAAELRGGSKEPRLRSGFVGKKKLAFSTFCLLKFVCLVCGCVRITNGFGYQFLCNPTLSDCQHGLRNLIWVKKLKKQFLSGLSLLNCVCMIVLILISPHGYIITISRWKLVHGGYSPLPLMGKICGHIAAPRIRPRREKLNRRKS